MKARVYQRCPLCARVTPFGAAMTRCPHDGAVMSTHCLRCGAAISSPFTDRCAMCGASYRVAATQTGDSGQLKTPP